MLGDLISILGGADYCPHTHELESCVRRTAFVQCYMFHMSHIESLAKSLDRDLKTVAPDGLMLVRYWCVIGRFVVPIASPYSRQIDSVAPLPVREIVVCGLCFFCQTLCGALKP